MTDYGTAERHGDTTVLRFTRTLAHPPERVWAALTDPKEMLGWWGEADLEPTVGGSVAVTWLNTDDEGNHAVLRGTVRAWDPPRLLEIASDIHGTLRWELTPAGDGTLVRFVNSLALPGDRLTYHLSGWHVHLDFLADTLDGHPVDWSAWPLHRWERHFDAYTVRGLYEDVIAGWNARSGTAFAAPFAEDGDSIGYDGSHHSGRSGLAHDLQDIFDHHPTARYVTIVRDLRPLGTDAMILRAVTGLVPPGSSTVRPDTSAWQTVVAERRPDGWAVVLLQNTPTQFHGRPELLEQLTAELNAAA
jgi:uncharacterized protein (TIGR02246 family)